MTIDALLLEINLRGLQLRRSGDDLVLRDQNKSLDEELVSELRANKATLLSLLEHEGDSWWSPPFTIRPEMLPLVQLTQEEIDQIVSQVPGGAKNLQDIYPLAPLQEGILFHHLMAQAGDTYLLAVQLSFTARAQLDAYLAAIRAMVGRHDILRTSVMWEGLPEPLQVVQREADLIVEEVELDDGPGDEASRLYAQFDPRHFRIDVGKAPLMRLAFCKDARNNRWLLMILLHHLVGDHTTLDVMQDEVQACLMGRTEELQAPQPFRNFVAQARAEARREDNEEFFRKMLSDVNEPTAPFGLLEGSEGGTEITEAHVRIDDELTARLRKCGRKLGASVASLSHLAWARLLACVSGRQDVVFGTVVFGRMQGGRGADRVLGPCINTLPVRFRTGDQTVESGVRTMHDLLAELMDHEHASLSLTQRCSGVTAPTPLFSALMNYRHDGSGALRSSQLRKTLEGGEIVFRAERTNYPMALSVEDDGKGLGLVAQVQPPVDPLRVCEFMHTALSSLADALEDSPDRKLSELAVLPEAERRQVIEDWNRTEVTYGPVRSVHELFEEQAARTPDAAAVVFEGRGVSYGELNAMANRLGHYLQELGVGPEVRVGICLERSVEMVAGLLGILKAGGAYVPLDPEYPVERLSYMMQDAEAPVVLTESKWAGLLAGYTGRMVCLDEEREQIAQRSEEPLSVEVRQDNAVYVIYTSGSTGRPKGVVNTHGGVSNRLLWMQATYGLHSNDRVLQKTTFSFDVSVWEFFWPLLTGAALVLARPGGQRDSLYLVEVVREQAVTMMHFVPSMLRVFLSEADMESCTTLRDVMCSGEALPADLAAEFRRRCPNTRLHNLYGPTEAAVDVTFWECRSEEATVPIGRPIANTRIYILDEEMEPAPAGVNGELYIGGTGVARGYLNRSGLTAERFLPDPFMAEGGRLYRTGDRARWRSDGVLEYLGRSDDQVKIRGFRIELGEIETVLRQQPDVRDAAVLAREDTPGDKRLVAYYTTRSGNSELSDARELRSHLSDVLPDYMVPAAYVRLDSLPLTPTGKLDRKILPATEANAFSTAVYQPPQGEMETRLADIWAEVLGIDRIGRNDNFFSLGGHSLLAMRTVTLLRRALGVDVAIRDLFTYPELATLADALERANELPLLPIRPVQRTEHLPLSFAQKRLWFLAQMEGVSETYHISAGLRLKGDLDHQSLRHALDRIVERHEALRTTFALVDGDPVQRIASIERSRFHLVEHDLRVCSEAGAELEKLTELEASTPFDLENGPLLRGRLIRLADDEHVVLITMHHIVSDGWSMSVLVGELSALYSAFRNGQEDPLPELGIQHADYAVWQRQWVRGQILQQQADYWKRTLADAPALLNLPTDHPRPAEQSYEGTSIPLALDEALTAGLRALSKRHGTTLFMTTLAAWVALLARLSGQQDIVIGVPTANRGRAEIENLIGFFVNTLALRIDLSGAPSVSELLQRVRQQATAAQQHQDIPFEQVVELAQSARSLAHSPLFQVMLVWQNTPEDMLALPGLEVQPVQPARGSTAKFDLTLTLEDREQSIAGDIEFATSLFEPATIERYIGYFHNLLEAMVADDTQTVDRLPILSAIERRQVLYKWNNTETDFSNAVCIHQLFEEQVERTPGATAVVFEGESLSYAELNRRANQLAYYLRELGVRPDSRVALCLERSSEMIVALLAVLKAGGAYVPLDPVYPVERLRFMIQDSAPVALLTQSHLESLFTELDDKVAIIDLAAETPAWYNLPEINPDHASIGLTPDHLAYVIYTSGSTGKPKGVTIPHRNVVNFFAGMDKVIGCGPADTMLSVTAISFDISVLELFWTLTRGTKVVLVTDPLTSVSRVPRSSAQQRSMDYSLFYFASAGGEQARDKYRLLIEGAKFADQNGLAAVWTPERHFHQFGGLYPNPAVTGAAVAAVTKRIQVRAGSVVLPLHNVIRVAEEWSVVDNLSGGRVGLAFASGWHADDFVFAPESYGNRREITFDAIQTFLKLWQGEPVKVRSGGGNEIDVRLFPKPLQKRPPLWITAGGTPDTFIKAGEMGANVLTHLLGQTVEDVAEKLRLYRKARANGGYDPETGQVTLMLHTFLGTDQQKVKDQVRTPFREYLRSSADLTKNVARSLNIASDVRELNTKDMDALLDYAFNRYYEGGAMFGTPKSCSEMIEHLKEIGVTEIGCLIDFGVEQTAVLNALCYIGELQRPAGRPLHAARKSLGELALEHHATLMQCTPSMIQMLAEGVEGLSALFPLRALMVGGESFPSPLAQKIKEVLPCRLFNMYGPTETTIWSLVMDIEHSHSVIPIGRPIANTHVYILDMQGEPTPIGVAGELYIGGMGVARGYLNRPELTADKFLRDPFVDKPSARMYKTGDLARWLPNGNIEFLGRNDFQVKIRGFRIELGEIEAVLREQPGVREAAVLAREDTPGQKRLVAYVVGDVDVSELRSRLRGRLPDYMVPSAIVLLNSLPLTVNGKLDRSALPQPSLINQREIETPNSALEASVVAIWQSLLGSPTISVTANYFELGGDSLKLVTLQQRIATDLKIRVSIVDLFKYPTIRSLCHHLRVSAEQQLPSPPQTNGRVPERIAHLRSQRQKALA